MYKDESFILRILLIVITKTLQCTLKFAFGIKVEEALCCIWLTRFFGGPPLNFMSTQAGFEHQMTLGIRMAAAQEVEWVVQ